MQAVFPSRVTYITDDIPVNDVGLRHIVKNDVTTKYLPFFLSDMLFLP